MNLMLAVLLGHALGDFYFQTNNMASNKKTYILKHVLIYTITLTLVYFLLTKSADFLLFGLLIFTSHLIIDRLNIFISRRINNNYSGITTFVIDQILHISILIIFMFYFNRAALSDNSVNDIILILFILSYLIMPSSIVVDKVICMVSKSHTSNKFELDEGTVIGILERLLILAMGISGAIGGIGFLIAAKTMVRYGQFEDKGGAEFRSKYLIGTLLSVLLGFLFYLVYTQLK